MQRFCCDTACDVSPTSELFEFNKLLTIYLITGLVLAVWVMHDYSPKNISWLILLYAMLCFLCDTNFATVFSIDVHTSILDIMVDLMAD